jgi:hypothetical protein
MVSKLNRTAGTSYRLRWRRPRPQQRAGDHPESRCPKKPPPRRAGSMGKQDQPAPTRRSTGVNKGWLLNRHA